MRTPMSLLAASLLALLALVTTASAAPLPGPTGYALTDDGALATFDAAAPQHATVVGSITGLADGETVVGIDFRSAGGALYGLTSASRVCTIDLVTAVAASCVALSVPLSGSAFGIDFNPAVDRLRVVSDTGQNLRINVATGATTVDTPLSYQAGDVNEGTAPHVVAVAYTNNDNDQFASPTPPMPTPTMLFDIDTALDALSQQVNPNGGLLSTKGALGHDSDDQAGFDIRSEIVNGVAVANVAYASLGMGGTEKLYTIDLATGQASKVAPFGDLGVADIAFPIDS